MGGGDSNADFELNDPYKLSLKFGGNRSFTIAIVARKHYLNLQSASLIFLNKR